MIQQSLLYGLEGDANNVADKLPDRVLEAGDPRAQFRDLAILELEPEILEIAALKQVRQVDDVFDRGLHTLK